MHARQRRNAIRCEHAQTEEVGGYAFPFVTMSKGKNKQELTHYTLRERQERGLGTTENTEMVRNITHMVQAISRMRNSQTKRLR